MKSEWFVYMLRTKSGSLYTGISTDVSRRMTEHAGKVKGAKSLRGKGPLELAWQICASNRSEASILEARIKKLARLDKEKLIRGNEEVFEGIHKGLRC